MFDGPQLDALAGGFLSTSQGTSTKKAKSSRPSRIVPVTNAMIENMAAGADTIRFGTVEFSQVSVVGLVRKVEESQIFADIILDDGSGRPIVARRYVKEEGKLDDLKTYLNTYVKVSGNVTTFNNAKALTVFGLSRLTSVNQITQHFLEDALNQITDQDGNINFNPPVKTLVITSGFSPPDFTHGLTGLRGEIISYLSTCTSDEGFSFSDIKAHFGHVPLPKLKQEVDFLSSEGHIYSTIDEQHFRTTD